MLLLALSFHVILIFTIIVPSFEYNVTIRPRVVKPDGYQFSPDNDFIYVAMANWTLRVQRNVNLILSSEIADTMTSDHFGRCEFYHGRLLSEDALSSLTICGDKFYASVNVGSRVFFVEPLNASHHHLYEHTDTGKNAKRSQRYLRSTFYDLTGDVLEIGNDDFNGTKKGGHTLRRNERRRTSYQLKSQWKKNAGPERRIADKYSTPRWIELAVAADYSVITFHGDSVKQYIMSLLNIVSTIYQDPTLDANLHIVVVKILLYPNKKDGMVRPGNARQSLENVNNWNRKLLTKTDVNHDVALWLTKLDIEGASGFAPVSGACDPYRSCALNQEEGLSSAFIIAHEIAHILGLSHDGDKHSGNYCYREASRGSVMAPIVAATFHNFRWSPCSRKELRYLLKKWSCFLNRPNENKVVDLQTITQQSLTMDSQCRMEFGDGYEMCKSIFIPNLCSQLWCGQKNATNVCKTKKGSPLEGTACGDGKQCVSGSCKSIDQSKIAFDEENLTNRDGSWSTWSQWGRCSTSCGVGVQFRNRTCLNNLSVSNSSVCEGEKEMMRICDHQKCNPRQDNRQQQCYQLPKVMNFGARSWQFNSTWLSYISDDSRNSCKLTCRNKESGQILYTNVNLIDGTPCSYSTTNICIQGKCHQMGCDNVLGSAAAADTCGVCNGNSSSCDNISNKFHRKLRRGVTRLVIIPEAAYDVKVDITLPPELLFENANFTVVMKDRRRERYKVLDSLFKMNFKPVAVEGTLFYGQKIDNTIVLWTKGPTLGEIIISIVVPGAMGQRGLTITTVLRHVVNRNDEQPKNKYTWIVGGWGPCSVACGKGNRYRTIACKNVQTGKLVLRRKCTAATKPTFISEQCINLSCDFKWLVGPWGNCSASCGNSGVQRRQIYCVRKVYNVNILISRIANHFQYSELPEKCAFKKMPLLERYCKTDCTNK